MRILSTIVAAVMFVGAAAPEAKAWSRGGDIFIALASGLVIGAVIHEVTSRDHHPSVAHRHPHHHHHRPHAHLRPLPRPPVFGHVAYHRPLIAPIPRFRPVWIHRHHLVRHHHAAHHVRRSGLSVSVHLAPRPVIRRHVIVNRHYAPKKRHAAHRHHHHRRHGGVEKRYRLDKALHASPRHAPKRAKRAPKVEIDKATRVERRRAIRQARRAQRAGEGFAPKRERRQARLERRIAQKDVLTPEERRERRRLRRLARRR